MRRTGGSRMTGARRETDLADMASRPMSAGWYLELGYLFDVIRNLRNASSKSRSGALPPLQVAQFHADCAMEHIHLLRRTMEAAGVLDAGG